MATHAFNAVFIKTIHFSNKLSLFQKVNQLFKMGDGDNYKLKE